MTMIVLTLLVIAILSASALFWLLAKMTLYCGQLQRDLLETRQQLTGATAIIDALKNQCVLLGVRVGIQQANEKLAESIENAAYTKVAEHFVRKDGRNDA